MSGKLIALLAVAGLVLFLIFKGKGATTLGTNAQPFHGTATGTGGFPAAAQGGILALENGLSAFANLFKSMPPNLSGPGQSPATSAAIFGVLANPSLEAPEFGYNPAYYGPQAPIIAPDIVSPDSGIVSTDVLAGLGTSFDAGTLAPPLPTYTLSFDAGDTGI